MFFAKLFLPALGGLIILLVPPSLGQALANTAVLDPGGKYRLSWDFTDSYISFDVEVKTRGYVGLGFSPNGGMAGSDIVIGWVDDNTGQGYLSDRHAVDNSRPLVDEMQDYSLQAASQNETHTVLRFSRSLNLCGDEDHSIADETVRLIWAYNDKDSDADGQPSYHGAANRGSKSVFLLNPQTVVPELPNDVIQHEFLNPSVPIPVDETTYWCQAFAVPRLSTKHHVIKVEPIIQPGLESEVHHILLYGCYHETNSTLPGYGHECYHPNMPNDFNGCSAVLYSWAIGGGPLYFPVEAGLPFGYEDDPTMILMETHYDNPQRQTGLVDSSGLRFYMTPTLRPNDAGIMETGISVLRNHVIPPFAKSFQSNGHCFPECLSQAMAASNQTEFKVFGYMLHSHLAGHAITIRHFRNGEELPHIAVDRNYDFNFQECRLLKDEATVKPNDHFITECYYRTDDRTEVTNGGLSTKDEMCLGFILYYPRIALTNCQSSISRTRLGEVIGVTAENDGSITAPPEHAGKSVFDVIRNDIDWRDEKTRQDFQEKYNEEGKGGYYAACYIGKTYYPVMYTTRPLPRKIKERPEVGHPVCGSVSFQPSTLMILSSFTLLLAGTVVRV